MHERQARKPSKIYVANSEKAEFVLDAEVW